MVPDDLTIEEACASSRARWGDHAGARSLEARAPEPKLELISSSYISSICHFPPLTDTEEGFADAICSIPLHGWGQVGVQVREQCRICMSETFGRHLWWNTTRKHERCAGVTKSVSGQPWQFQLRTEGAQKSRQILGW